MSGHGFMLLGFAGSFLSGHGFFLPGFSIFFAFFVLFAVGVIALGIWMWRRDKKRRAALRELAEERGWSYIPRDKKDRVEWFRGFEPFGQGHTRYAADIMAGATEAGRFEVFEYHYAVTTRTGKSTSTQHYHFKVVTLEMPIEGPGLLIRDEHIGHKIAKALGRDNISFESHEFSRKFWVRCPDRRFAYDVIHPATMEYLMAVPGWTWQWRGRTLMMHRAGKPRAEEIEGIIKTADGFRGLVPRHMVAEVRG